MIQFNLKEYLKNPKRKVITRNGEDVRIICTDKKKAVRPLIALITKDDGNIESLNNTSFDWKQQGKQYWFTLKKGNSWY